MFEFFLGLFCGIVLTILAAAAFVFLRMRDFRPFG